MYTYATTSLQDRQHGLTRPRCLLTLQPGPTATAAVDVATCERSFSKLKLVKTYLRSQMSDARLSSLAVLSTERELAEQLYFHEVIKDFAVRKARKVHI